MPCIELLSIIAKASSLFLRNGLKFKSLVYDFMTELGSVLRIDRIYLFQNTYVNEELCMSQVLEWCNHGIVSEFNNTKLQNLPYRPDRQDILDCFINEEPYIWYSTEKHYELLEEQGIKSLCLFPIYVSSYNLWGYIGFDDCILGRKWSDFELYVLMISANMIGDCIWRIQKEHSNNKLL